VAVEAATVPTNRRRARRASFMAEPFSDAVRIGDGRYA